MPICPTCHQGMAVAEQISVAGVTNKAVSWRCAIDAMEATAVHPVQYPHLKVGSQEETSGRCSRIVKLEMQGAELLVYRLIIAPSPNESGR